MAMRVGITGQDGFIGTHMFNFLRTKEDIERIPFSRDFFKRKATLDSFTANCDILIHLSGLSRGDNQQKIYDVNMELVRNLIDSFERIKTKPFILFASTIHEDKGTLYHKSKRDGGNAIQDWGIQNSGRAATLVMPNVYGPCCKPDFNSFIATFCSSTAKGEIPEIINDTDVNLIYITDLCSEIYNLMKSDFTSGKFYFSRHTTKKVSAVLHLLTEFKKEYVVNGRIPAFNDYFEFTLFNTFLSYL